MILIWGYDHTDISSDVFIYNACHLQVCQFNLISKLSKSTPSSKLCMEVYEAEDSQEKSKKVIVYNPTSANRYHIQLYIWCTKQRTFYGATY